MLHMLADIRVGEQLKSDEQIEKGACTFKSCVLACVVYVLVQWICSVVLALHLLHCNCAFFKKAFTNIYRISTQLQYPIYIIIL